MAGKRKSPPGEPTPMQKITQRVNTRRAKIKKTQEELDAENLANEARGLYKPEYAEQALKLCYLGHTNEELATFFDVSFKTINVWIAQVEAFGASVRAGREEADMDMVNALRKLGLGHMVELNEQRLTKDGDIVDLRKDVYVPPNFNAIQLWLVNRGGGKWKMASAPAEKNPEGDEPFKDKVAKTQARRIKDALAEIEDLSDTE